MVGQEKVMGARHPKVFQTQGNLANLYRDKGTVNFIVYLTSLHNKSSDICVYICELLFSGRMGDAKEMYIKVVNGQSEVLGMWVFVICRKL